MKNKVWLITVLILAATLRLWNLDHYPAGLNADEAALGYNAYSLLTTGKDEYGASWPLVFKSFGDYKPGLYVYLAVPMVAVMGLNEWSVRLPSAILAVATVYLIYLLAKKIYQSEVVGLSSAMFLAVSPWHLHFSRGGWETNAATLFITLGVYLFTLGLRKAQYLFLSFLAILASMYTYQSPRLTIPILVISLVVIYRYQLIKQLRYFLKYIPFLVIISVPLFLQFTGGKGEARFTGLSFLSNSGPISRLQELRGEHSNPQGVVARLIHNKVTTLVPEFLGHYLDHFSSNFLFINGDPLIRNKVPETGQFYLIEAIFLLIGIIYITKDRLEHKWLLLLWISTAPLASSLTYQTPHALRAFTVVIPLTLVMGYGLVKLLNITSGSKKYFLGLILTVVLIFELAHYLESYYVHYPKRYPLAWEYGFKEMVQKMQNYQNEYNKVVITDRYDQPYILVLFYERFNPAKYQSQAKLSERDKFNFGTVRAFENYEFRSIKKDEIKNGQHILYIASPDEVGDDYQGFDRVQFPNKKPAFIFIKT